MYKSVVLLCLVYLCCGCVWAQSTYFNKTHDFSLWNPATSAVEVDDGYMVVGQIPTTEDRKVFLLKTDLNGDTLWLKIYGTAPMIHYTGVGSSLIPTADSGFVFCGTIADTAIYAYQDMLLMKFDSLGDTLWTKRYGGSGQDVGQDCAQTLDNGLILIGFTRSFGDTSGDIYLVKTDSVGNLEWDTTYGFSGSLETGISVDITDDGGYILGGYSTINGNRIWILKVDSNGDTLWTTKINVNGTVSGFVIRSLDGGYIVHSSKDKLMGNGKDGYIAKLDSNGAIIWERTYVGSSNDDWFSQVIELSDGSIVAAGQSRNENNISSGWLLKAASNGDSLWSRKFSVPDSLSQQFWSLRVTQDKGFIMSGYAVAPTQDTWLVKTNCLGYEAPPLGSFTFVSDTLTATFVNQSEKAGTYLWDFGDSSFSTDTNPAHNYQDSGTYVVTLTAVACGDTSIFVDTVQVSIPVWIYESNAWADKIGLFPNPTTGLITITGLSQERIRIMIYTVMGELVHVMEINQSNDPSVDLFTFPRGL